MTDMKTYQVYFEQNRLLNIEVKAKDENEAEKKAKKKLINKTVEEIENECQKDHYEYACIEEV